jgi:hypothetical protein
MKEVDMEADDGEQDVKNKHGEQEVVLIREKRNCPMHAREPLAFTF